MRLYKLLPALLLVACAVGERSEEPPPLGLVWTWAPEDPALVPSWVVEVPDGFLVMATSPGKSAELAILSPTGSIARELGDSCGGCVVGSSKPIATTSGFWASEPGRIGEVLHIDPLPGTIERVALGDLQGGTFQRELVVDGHTAAVDHQGFLVPGDRLWRISFDAIVWPADGSYVPETEPVLDVAPFWEPDEFLVLGADGTSLQGWGRLRTGTSPWRLTSIEPWFSGYVLAVAEPDAGFGAGRAMLVEIGLRGAGLEFTRWGTQDFEPGVLTANHRYGLAVASPATGELFVLDSDGSPAWTGQVGLTRSGSGPQRINDILCTIRGDDEALVVVTDESVSYYRIGWLGGAE